MKKLWNLALANLKKTKSVSVTLAVLFLLAALLVNIGLLIIVNYGSYFTETKNELNSSDAYYYIPDELYNQSVMDYLNENEHVKKTQENSALVMGGNIKYIGKDKSFSLICFNMDETRQMSKYKFVGEKESPVGDEMAVYVPDLFKAVGGYALGDTITVKCFDEKGIETEQKKFVIRGFIEDVFFSSTDTGLFAFYLPEDTYNKLLADNENVFKAKVIFTNLDNVNQCSKVEQGIRDTLKIEASSLMSGDSSKMLFSIDVSLIELSRCMMASMVAIMMVLFAIVIVIVCLLVVRFRIINSLEDDILKIGSLKSIGYTDSQIRLSLILQFLIVAIVGGGVGIGLSYLCIPPVSKIFEKQSGLFWSQSFDPSISIPVFVALMIIVALMVYFVSRKVKKLTPVLALRGETNKKRLKKNHMPLEKRKGGLTLILALKSVCQNVKQNLMIIVILVAVTFAGVYGVIMYYNTTVDTTAFQQVPGMEICNALVSLNNEKDMTKSIDKINQLDEVKYSQFVDETKVNVDDIEASCTLMESYENKNTKLVYEGKYPDQENEIVLAGILAERINKKVGDTVSVGIKGTKRTFTIVGLSNGSSMGGINCSMLLKDYQKYNSDFKQQLLYIYLKDGTDAKKFIKKAKGVLDKNDYISFTNFDKAMAEGMESYQNIVAAMGGTMFIVTILIITLVLYFVISSSIIRKRREIGIKKAIGFSTWQLMNEYSLSFLIPVAIGTIIGSVLGVVCCNPMMSAAMKGAGIMKAGFIISPLWSILFGIVVLLLSYVLSVVITWRIRKISAYMLVTE